MVRVVWGLLFVSALLLSAFLLYLTLTRSDLPLRGFALAAGILVVGLYPLVKLIRGEPGPKPD